MPSDQINHGHRRVCKGWGVPSSTQRNPYHLLDPATQTSERRWEVLVAAPQVNRSRAMERYWRLNLCPFTGVQSFTGGGVRCRHCATKKIEGSSREVREKDRAATDGRYRCLSTRPLHANTYCADPLSPGSSRTPGTLKLVILRSGPLILRWVTYSIVLFP